jgi:hypothetical protein
MPVSPDSAPATPADSAAPVRLRRKRVWIYNLAFIAGGAVLGFGYYKLVGCRTGACPITANPFVATLYGALMGFLASGMLER